VKLYLPALAFALLAAAAPRAEALTLALKESASVTGNETLVGDVTEPSGDAPASLLMAPLGASPLLGSNRVWDRLSVAQAAAKHAPDQTVEWQGAARCTVARPAKRLAEPDVLNAIASALRTATGGVGQVHVHEIAQGGEVLAPEQGADLTVDLAPTALNNSWAVATLRVAAAGETAFVKTVRFRWSWTQQAWQAARDLAAGAPVNPNDFKPIQINTLSRRQQLVLDPALPMDAVIARGLRSGSLLSQSDIKTRGLVKKGSPVRLLYAVGAVQVAMETIAMQDGGRGEMIQVINPTSRKRLVGRVVDESRVEYVQ